MVSGSRLDQSIRYVLGPDPWVVGQNSSQTQAILGGQLVRMETWEQYEFPSQVCENGCFVPHSLSLKHCLSSKHSWALFFYPSLFFWYPVNFVFTFPIIYVYMQYDLGLYIYYYFFFYSMTSFYQTFVLIASFVFAPTW